MIKRAEEQYLEHLAYIHQHGTDIPNERTGIGTRVVINRDLVYDASSNKAPILTTRKMNVKLAIAELLGYIRGVTSAAEMRELGTKSWDANANENQAWLNNPNRKGEDDLGMIYGAVARNWPAKQIVHRDGRGDWHDDTTIDLFAKVYKNLRAGKDDRGEIITFWNPGLFEYGCLRPCMYEHQFSLVGEDLYLNSTQRSSDWPLGVASNMIQVWLFLRLMAQITKKNPKFANHRHVNAHIYQNQLEQVPTQLERELLVEPTIDINPGIRTLKDLETWVTVENGFVINYPEYHPPIKYPFAV